MPHDGSRIYIRFSRRPLWVSRRPFGAKTANGGFRAESGRQTTTATVALCLRLLCQLQGIIDFDAEIPNRTVKLGVTQ